MKYYRFLMALGIHIVYGAFICLFFYVGDIFVITRKCYDKYIVKEETKLAIETFDNCFPD